MNDDKMLLLLNDIQRQIIQTKTTRDLGELCKKYKKIRPKIIAILPFIEKIPIYGKKIADLIRMLIKLADEACSKKHGKRVEV
jgi:hypothetical protein